MSSFARARPARRTSWSKTGHLTANYSNRYSGNTAFAGVLDYLWNWTRDGYAAELSLEGRDDAVPPLCFEFDVDCQRNIYKGTKGKTVADQRQEHSAMEICQVVRHVPDAPNGVTAAEVMALSGLKKWKRGDLLGRAVNGKYAVRVGLGDTRNPSTYYRTPTGKAMVEQRQRSEICPPTSSSAISAGRLSRRSRPSRSMIGTPKVKCPKCGGTTVHQVIASTFAKTSKKS